MTRSRRGTQRDRRRKQPAPVSAWARLSRGTRTLVALVATTAVVAIVPGVIPYVSDRALDLFRVPLLQVDSAFGPDHGLYLAAAETVATEPPDPLHDPRFIPAGYSAAKLTLEGRRAAGIAVTDMTVEIVERHYAARKGTLYGIPPQGESDNTALAVNLDAAAPTAVAADGGKPYFAAKHITVARGELWVINVVASTARCECAWRLHLKVRYRGSEHEIVVPPTGRAPFRMTAFAPKPEDYAAQYVWNRAGTIVRNDCTTARKTCAATYLPPVTQR